MKNFLLLISLSCICSWTWALDYSGQETNGGDPYSAEFFSIWDNMMYALPEETSLIHGENVTKAGLQNLRKQVKISSAESVTLDGVEKGAVNKKDLSGPHIVISRSYWDKIQKHQKQLLVLHEILPLLGCEDQNYQHSSLLFNIVIQKWSRINKTDILQGLNQCDPTTIQSLTKAQFQKIFTEEERIELVFNASRTYCSAAVKRFADLSANLNTCAYSSKNSPITSLIHNYRGAGFLTTLHTLRKAGAASMVQCGSEVADACYSLLVATLPKEIREQSQIILKCPTLDAQKSPLACLR